MGSLTSANAKSANYVISAHPQKRQQVPSSLIQGLFAMNLVQNCEDNWVGEGGGAIIGYPG